MTNTDKEVEESKIPTVQTDFSRDRLGYIVKRGTVEKKGYCWHCCVYPLRTVEHPCPQVLCQRCWLIQKSVGSTPLKQMVQWNKQYELDNPINAEPAMYQTASKL